MKDAQYIRLKPREDYKWTGEEDYYDFAEGAWKSIEWIEDEAETEGRWGGTAYPDCTHRVWRIPVDTTLKRLLNIGEVVREGDEYYREEYGWRPVVQRHVNVGDVAINTYVSEWDAVRRPW